jgi:hypothetical protein
MDWLIALPIAFAAVTALYAAGWVFIGLASAAKVFRELASGAKADGRSFAGYSL